jgi:hypothetical protein
LQTDQEREKRKPEAADKCTVVEAVNGDVGFEASGSVEIETRMVGGVEGRVEYRLREQ